MAAPIYSAIPAVPAEGISNAQFQLFNSLRENVELLTGTRGGVGNAAQAVNKGSITISNVPTQNMTRVTAEGAGFSVSGAQLASLADYNRLRQDVQTLAGDVANLRATIETLIAQLKA